MAVTSGEVEEQEAAQIYRPTAVLRDGASAVWLIRLCKPAK